MQNDTDKYDKGVVIALTMLIIGLLSVFVPFQVFNGLTLFGFTVTIDRLDELGQFVGGITTPFLSTSAFVLLYLTYKSQKTELLATRNILTKQSTIVEKQLFESTFFNTLELFNNIIQSVAYTQSNDFLDSGIVVDDKRYKGRECFKHLYFEFKRGFEKLVNEWCVNNLHTAEGEKISISKEQARQLIKDAYRDFFTSNQAELGHYFRTMYNIVKLVKDNNRENPKYYTNLVRSQLSSYEHLLLFYNCLSDYGPEFYPLVVEFSMLDGLPEDELLEEKDRSFYPEEAYR